MLLGVVGGRVFHANLLFCELHNTYMQRALCAAHSQSKLLFVLLFNLCVLGCAVSLLAYSPSALHIHCVTFSVVSVVRRCWGLCSGFFWVERWVFGTRAQIWACLQRHRKATMLVV